METILTYLEIMAPALIAVMSLVMFTPKTRWLCYTAVTLAVVAELIPDVINITNLSVCVACLAALLFSECLRAQKVTQPLVQG